MRHTSDTMKIDYLAIAILRQDDQIIIVQDHTADDHRPYWALPGGMVEAGELVTEALVREVQEEAGVQISVIGQLVALSQIDHPADACQTLVFFFEIAHWQGTLQCQDPDSKVSSVELVALPGAINRLQRNGGWPGIQEPLLAYLQGEVSAGMLWIYREGTDGQRRLGALPANTAAR